MRSYTSTKFFTAYFIPLIPLGRQKIVSECPHCKEALGMSLRKWTRARSEDLPKAVADYEQAPSDATAAKHALATIHGLQDRPSLRRIGPIIRTAFAHDAEVLAFLAGTYSHLCMDREADALYLEAVGLSDDPTIAAEADTHLQLQSQRPPAPPNRLLQSLPVLIVPVALLFALSVFVQRAASSHPDKAYLLNGLSRPYLVVVNGHEVTLAPQALVATAVLRFGKNELAPSQDAGFTGLRQVSIDVPWHKRAFGGPVIVVNPDEAGVLLWERTGYSASAVPDDAYISRLATGRLVHVHEDIDFPFVDFPERISLSSSTTLAFRTRLSQFSRGAPGDVTTALFRTGDMDAVRGYIHAKLRADDDVPMIVHAGRALLPRTDFLSLAEPRLSQRPVRIEWHRAYQNLVEGTPEGEDLEAHYRKLVADEPDSSALTYLWSRVVEDPDACIAILTRAARLPESVAYAHFGLGYRCILDGDFENARAHCETALTIDPTNDQIRDMRTTALLGLRAYERLEQEHGDPLAPLVAPDWRAFLEHIHRLGKLGRPDQARSEFPRFLARIKEIAPQSDADRDRAMGFFHAELALALGDRDAYVRAIEGFGEPHWRFQKALVTRELDEALGLAAAHDEVAGVLEHTTLYALLVQAKRSAEAATQLEKAVALLSAGDSTARKLGAMLQGETPPDPRLAAHTCPDPATHAIYLIALARRFPANAPGYLERAARLQFKDTFYTLALTDLAAR